MIKGMPVVSFLVILLMLLWSRPGLSQDTRLPNGRMLSPIKDGVYPQDYYPNTEQLAPDEMRIIALGTGMPQVIQKKTKASGWYVELGMVINFCYLS